MDIESFARNWESSWNSHNLDLILKHYCDDVVFRSRKAIPITGSGELVGKGPLRSYWEKALEQQPDLRFEVQECFLGHEMAVITYRNHKGIIATEIFYFDENGMVYQAAACHRTGKIEAREATK